MMKLEVTSPLHSNLRALASSVPIGQRGLVHIWGRNDTPIGQKIGISWVVKDPTGKPVEEYSDWKGWPFPTELDPGDDHEFIGGRFDIDKEGTYTIKVDLLMGGPDSPVIVDTYDGDLCTTTIEIPPECEIDADCPEGYVCVGGVCVPEEKFPWAPVIIGAGAVIAAIGLAVAAKKRRGG